MSQGCALKNVKIIIIWKKELIKNRWKWKITRCLRDVWNLFQYIIFSFSLNFHFSSLSLSPRFLLSVFSVAHKFCFSSTHSPFSFSSSRCPVTNGRLSTAARRKAGSKSKENERRKKAADIPQGEIFSSVRNSSNLFRVTELSLQGKSTNGELTFNLFKHLSLTIFYFVYFTSSDKKKKKIRVISQERELFEI